MGPGSEGRGVAFVQTQGSAGERLHGAKACGRLRSMLDSVAGTPWFRNGAGSGGGQGRSREVVFVTSVTKEVAGLRCRGRSREWVASGLRWSQQDFSREA